MFHVVWPFSSPVSPPNGAQDLERTINEQDEQRRCLKCFEKAYNVSRVSAVQNVASSKSHCSTGLRLPWDRRHSLQRCSDVITSDTNSSERQLNLALSLILKEALVAWWKKQSVELDALSISCWLKGFPFLLHRESQTQCPWLFHRCRSASQIGKALQPLLCLCEKPQSHRRSLQKTLILHSKWTEVKKKEAKGKNSCTEELMWERAEPTQSRAKLEQPVLVFPFSFSY